MYLVGKIIQTLCQLSGGLGCCHRCVTDVYSTYTSSSFTVIGHDDSVSSDLE